MSTSTTSAAAAHDEPPVVGIDPPGVLTLSPLRLRLQQQAGVCPIRTPVGDPAWLVTRHAEVATLLTDNRLGRSHEDPAHAPKFLDNPMLDMLITDAPPEVELQEHLTKRAMYTASFAARRVLDRRASVEAIAERLLDRIEEAGAPADLHAAWSMPFPQQALCDMMGIPEEEREPLLSMMDRVGDTTDAADSHAGMEALFERASATAAGVRAAPGDNVVSRFVETGLDDRAIATHIVALLFTGLSGLASHVDFGTLLLLRNPEQRRRAVADPDVMSRAVDEVLRATIGAPVLPRYAHTDIEVDGVTIRRGDLVMVDFSLANHDPRVFDDPFTFDVDRVPNPHFTFSHGLRHCTGAPLVRIILGVAYRALFERFPDLRLAVDDSELAPHPGGRLAGGLAALPVTW